MLPRKKLLLLILLLGILSILFCGYTSLSLLAPSHGHSISMHAVSTTSGRSTRWEAASHTIAVQLLQVQKAKTKDYANEAKDHDSVIHLAVKTIPNLDSKTVQLQKFGATKPNQSISIHLNEGSSRSPPLKHLRNTSKTLKPKGMLLQRSGLSLNRNGSQKTFSARSGESIGKQMGKHSALSRRKANVTRRMRQHHSLEDPEHKLGQTDFGLYSLYKDVDVVAKYCTPELCLSVKGPESLNHQGCLRNALSLIDLRRWYNNQNLTLNRCSCKLESKKIKYGRVALVSLPGSGNTWVRGLLEQATGLCTGSMWCDPGLRASHFCGEGLRDKRLLVVKNHDPTVRWKGQKLQRGLGFSEHNKPEFEAAIFIHRTPSDAIIAEHNRAIASALWETSVREGRRNELKLSNHLLAFGKEYFGNNSDWDSKVRELTLVWERMVRHLLLDSKDRPVLLVHYENLKVDPVREVERMVNFLGYNLSEDVLRGRISQFGDFHRNHTRTFEHFTPAQKKFIAATYSRVAAAGIFEKSYLFSNF